jgi:DNA-binding protein H-NS
MTQVNDVQAIDDQIEALKAKKKALLDGQRKEALQQVKQSIRNYGFTASELGLVAASGKKRAAKYANPANPQQTWGGGAQPKWVKEHLAQGGTLADLLIKR